MFVLQKTRDEGTGNPYIARMFLGMFELRDMALSCLYPTENQEKVRFEFDKIYGPVLDALDACRKSTRELEALWANYIKKIEMGLIVSFDKNTIHVSESIDKELRDLITSILTNGVIALKGTQNVTNFWGLDIGCLFMKEDNFQKGIEAMRTANELLLADFLTKVRNTWSESFISRRNSIEHQGWLLPQVRFLSVLSNGIGINEPVIDGIPVTKYARLMTNSLISTIENIVAYAIQRVIVYPMIIVEIPQNEREPQKVLRFRFDLDRPEVRGWQLEYSVTDFI